MTTAARAGENLAERAVARRLRKLAAVAAERDRLKAELERDLAAVHERYGAGLQSAEGRLKRLAHSLERFCRTRRDLLVGDGRKSLATECGEIAFRRVPSAVEVREGCDGDDACRRLLECGCNELVRVRRTLNRGAVRRAVESGRLGEGELKRAGLCIVPRPDAFRWRLRGVGQGGAR